VAWLNEQTVADVPIGELIPQATPGQRAGAAVPALPPFRPRADRFVALELAIADMKGRATGSRGLMAPPGVAAVAAFATVAAVVTVAARPGCRETCCG
jgi:hypothetical protein